MSLMTPVKKRQMVLLVIILRISARMDNMNAHPEKPESFEDV